MPHAVYDGARGIKPLNITEYFGPRVPVLNLGRVKVSEAAGACVSFSDLQASAVISGVWHI